MCEEKKKMEKRFLKGGPHILIGKFSSTKKEPLLTCL